MRLSLKIEIAGVNDDFAELLPHLVLSSKQVAQDEKWMRDMGITHVINCTKQPPFFPSTFKYLTVPISDSLMDGPELGARFSECFEFIDEALRNKSRCLLHCSAGISRSATVAIAYLMAREKKSLQEALSYTREKRPVISPNSGFMELLISFEMSLYRRNSLCLGVYNMDRYSSPKSHVLTQFAPLSSIRDSRIPVFFNEDDCSY